MAPAAGSVPAPSLQGVSPADPAAINAAAAAAAVPAPMRPANYPSSVATAPVSPGPAELPAAPDVVARGGIGGGPGGDNPADYEPAISANGRAAAAGSSRASDGAAHAEPPSLAEIGGDLPSLRLDLHVYSTRPADRYALINMHRVHEGDVLPEGPRVVANQARRRRAGLPRPGVHAAPAVGLTGFSRLGSSKCGSATCSGVGDRP